MAKFSDHFFAQQKGSHDLESSFVARINFVAPAKKELANVEVLNCIFLMQLYLLPQVLFYVHFCPPCDLARAGEFLPAATAGRE